MLRFLKFYINYFFFRVIYSKLKIYWCKENVKGIEDWLDQFTTAQEERRVALITYMEIHEMIREVILTIGLSACITWFLVRVNDWSDLSYYVFYQSMDNPLRWSKREKGKNFNSRKWRQQLVNHHDTQWRNQSEFIPLLYKYFMLTCRENDRFLKKWTMIVFRNLRSRSKSAGWLGYWWHFINFPSFLSLVYFFWRD